MNTAETLQQSERIMLVQEFSKMNSLSELKSLKFPDHESGSVLPKYRYQRSNPNVKSYTPFDQVWEFLRLNGISLAENKEMREAFEKDESLCEMFLKTHLPQQYFSETTE